MRLSRRSLIAAIAGAALAATGTAAVVTSAEGIGPPSPENSIPTDIPPAKQAFLRTQATGQAQRAATARPIVHNPASLPTLPASCPVDVHPGVITPFCFGPFPGGKGLVNDVGALSPDGWPYMIYAGATDDDPPQGSIVVIKESNPCLDPDRKQTYIIKTYLTPYRKGAVTITSVAGSIILFTLPDGTSGGFDFVTGQYL
jgi:hypothetical protein